jgi:hypothetical protein
VGQQGFNIEFRVDDEHAAEFAWRSLDIGRRGAVEIEGAFSGFVEFV